MCHRALVVLVTFGAALAVDRDVDLLDLHSVVIDRAGVWSVVTVGSAVWGSTSTIARTTR